MKIIVKGYQPQLVIADMKRDTKGYAPFKNIFITRKNLFVCLDTEVYNSVEEIFQFYGEDCDYIFVERNIDGSYFFNFAAIFTEVAFAFYPAEYDELLGKSDSFIAVNHNFLEIENLNSEDNFFSEEELEQDILQLDTLVGLPILSIKELNLKLDEAVGQENYEKASEIRDELARRK